MDEPTLSPETLAALQAFRAEASLPRQGENEAMNSSSNSKDYIAENNVLYKTKEYWDDRFQTEETYDWLLTYPHIKQYILPYIKPEHKILIVGCGNSTFSADLYDDGFQNIVNIDFSKIVINRMAEANKSRPNMTWLEMDMCDLQFDNSAFDVVIDKATMDALLVDEGSVWDPEVNIIHSVDKMCRDISRVLTPQGVFLQISFSQPHFRTKYLMGQRILNTVSDPYATAQGFTELYGWNLSVSRLSVEAGCLDTFLYTMTK